MITMILAVGEILIDQFPGYQREGGAPFNFAFHLKHLGLPVRLITRIGDDANGQGLQRMLYRHGFELSDIQIDPHHKTGVVNVALDDAGIPTFQIFPDVAYDYLQLDHFSGNTVWQESSLIYYGTLIQRSKIGFKQVERLLSRRSSAMSIVESLLNLHCLMAFVLPFDPSDKIKVFLSPFLYG